MAHRSNHGPPVCPRALQDPQGRVEVIGYDFRWRDRGQHLAAVSARFPREAGVVRLGLLHDPGAFAHLPQGAADLVLSGHTHGGQIWPFKYLVRLAVTFVAGQYRRGDAQLFVSRGTGYWGPPMRLAAPSEITEIVLRAGEPGGARAAA